MSSLPGIQATGYGAQNNNYGSGQQYVFKFPNLTSIRALSITDTDEALLAHNSRSNNIHRELAEPSNSEFNDDAVSNSIFLLPPYKKRLVARTDLINQLSSLLQVSKSNSYITNVVVVHGPPGIGKSTVVRQYCVANKDMYWAIFYVDSSSEMTIERAFEDITSCHPEYRGSRGHAAVASVKKWLENARRPWLMFFDKFHTMEKDFDTYLPASPYGTVVITSRDPHCCRDYRLQRMKVGPYSKEEAMQYLWKENLEKILEKGKNENMSRVFQQLEALAESLGFHPSLLTHAVSDLSSRRDLNFQPIHRLLNNYLKELNAPGSGLDTNRRLEEVTGPLKILLANHMAGTEEAVDQSVRDSYDLLCFFSFLGSTDIPYDIFDYILNPVTIDTSLKKICDDGRKQLSEREVSHAKKGTLISLLLPMLRGYGVDDCNPSFRIKKAVNKLDSLSLVNVASGFISISRFLQEMMRQVLQQKKRRDQVDGLVTIYTLSWCINHQYNSHSQAFRRSLVPHLEQVKAHIEGWAKMFDVLETEDAAEMLLKLSIAYFEDSKVESMQEAANMQMMVVSKLEIRSISKVDLLLLRARSQLAATLQDLNGPGQRLQAMQIRATVEQIWSSVGYVLESQSNISPVFVEDRKLASMSDLADSYDCFPDRRQESLGLRKSVYERREILEAEMRSCREELSNLHSKQTAVAETRDAKLRLARTYHLIGARDVAFKLREEVWTSVANDHEENDEDIFNENQLKILSDYADSLDSKGFWSRALEERKRVVISREQLLGSAHYDTLAAKSNLAISYIKLDQYEDAVELSKLVFCHNDTSHGRYHPSTLQALAALGRSLVYVDPQEASRITSEVAEGWLALEQELQRVGKPHDFESWAAKASRVAYLEDELKRTTAEDSSWTAKWEEALGIHEDSVLQTRQKIRSSEETETIIVDLEMTLLAENNLASFYSSTRRYVLAYEKRYTILERYRRHIAQRPVEAGSRAFLNILRCYARDCERLAIEWRPIPKSSEARSVSAPHSTGPEILHHSATRSLGKDGMHKREPRNPPEVMITADKVRPDDIEIASLGTVETNIYEGDMTVQYRGASSTQGTNDDSEYGDEARLLQLKYQEATIEARKEAYDYARSLSGPAPDADSLHAQEEYADCLLLFEGHDTERTDYALNLLKSVLQHWEEPARLGKTLKTEKLRERIQSVEKMPEPTQSRIRKWMDKVCLPAENDRSGYEFFYPDSEVV